MENDDLRYLAEDIASDILTVAYTSEKLMAMKLTFAELSPSANWITYCDC